MFSPAILRNSIRQCFCNHRRRLRGQVRLDGQGRLGRFEQGGRPDPSAAVQPLADEHPAAAAGAVGQADQEDRLKDPEGGLAGE